MSNDLKPCHCGSRPVVRKDRYGCWFVQCFDCEMQFGYSLTNGAVYQLKKGAIEAWNKWASAIEPQVVHCRECRLTRAEHGYLWCLYHDEQVEPNGFCHHFVRMDAEEEST